MDFCQFSLFIKLLFQTEIQATFLISNFKLLSINLMILSFALFKVTIQVVNFSKWLVFTKS